MTKSEIANNFLGQFSKWNSIFCANKIQMFRILEHFIIETLTTPYFGKHKEQLSITNYVENSKISNEKNYSIELVVIIHPTVVQITTCMF